MWKCRAAAAALVLLATSVASAESELPGADEALYACKKRTGHVTMTFKPELELKELLTWVVGFTCKEFVLDPRIVATGRKVALIVPGKLTPSEAYQVFVVALSTMGLTIVPKGKVLRIVESAAARQDTVPIYREGMPPAGDQVVRYLMRPEHAQPETLSKAFTAMKSSAGEINQLGSLLVITDHAGNVRDMLSIAKLVDVPGGTDAIYTIPVLHADATKLQDKLTSLLGVSTTLPAGKPETAVATSAAVPSKILVDERTNTLIVAASDAGFQRVKALVERLDISLEIEGGASIHVYQLDNAIAEELAKTLNDAIQTQPQDKKTTARAPAADGLGTTLEGQARVISDKPTNKLIVMSSGRDFLAIREVIKELDTPRRQVFIEALILEVQIGNTLDIGTSSHGGYSLDGGNSLLVGGVQTPNLKSLNLSTLSTASGLIGGLIGSSLTSSTSILGKSIPSYAVLFQALADNSRTNILSTPSIIALDNEQAKYKVGTNIPYKKGVLPTSTTTDSPLTTNIERQDLLLDLDIKPHISTNNSILLEVKHESKDLGDTTSELGPSWSTRSFETRVLVRDQQTILLGGLMQEREISSVAQVPLLGDIPILGYLFKYSHKTKKKTTLLIMLTPYIIKDQLELEAIRERKVREYDEFIGQFRSLDGMKYQPRIDYRRKRGLIEEINRTVQDVEDETAARAALPKHVRVVPGLVEPTPN